MSKIAVMMVDGRADGQMSAHFGKAEWIMVADGESAEFIKNKELNGQNAAGIVVDKGCTDVIVADIGGGALGHLQAGNIRAWAAPGPLTGEEALRRFRAGQLPAVTTAHAGAHQGGACCCSGSCGKGDSPCCKG